MRRQSSPRRPVIVGVLLLAASLALLKFDRRGAAPGPVGSLLARTLAPLQGVVTSAGRSVRELWLDYVALTHVREDNRRLEAELRDLQERAAAADGLQAENARLRSLLELGDRRKDLRLRAARVVSRSTSPYFRVLRLVLDTGDADVESGMPVVAPGGVVGQLRTVYGGRAEVLLITDPRSAVDVVLETSHAHGVAVGTGESDRYAARLQYLQRSDETVVGERVLTTGDDGRYPRGLVVGKVAEVQSKGHGLFQDAEVEPSVDLSALDEVYIVLGPTGLTPDGKELKKPEPGDKPGEPASYPASAP